MKTPRRFGQLGIVVAGFAIGLLMSYALSGCNGPTEGLARAIRSIGSASLSENAGRELMRFEAVYDRYVVPQHKDDYYQQRDHFVDAMARVMREYVQEVEPGPLVDAAIKGVEDLKVEPGTQEPRAVVDAGLEAMLASLDPHSSYMDRDELNEMQVSTKGEFGGLGILVTMENDLVKVISPMDDTPAAKAGIEAGDLVTHIDATPVKGMSLQDAVKRMRGKPGTDIVLTVKRGEKAPFDVTLTRDIIEVKAVKWRAEGDIGYVRVASFSKKVEEGIEQALDELREQIPDMKGLVLDLRRNPGGLLDQAEALADAFLDRGVIVSTRGRDGADSRVVSAVSGDLAKGLPMVLLIDGGSASASEIVAGALQDHNRAVVMGQRSFGKGSVQTIMPLDLEGALRLTTALYYMPSGRSIQASGVTPQIRLIPPPEPEPEKTAANDNEPAEGADDKAKEEDQRPRREADLPGVLHADGAGPTHIDASVQMEDCPEAGEEGKDKALGCALLYLHKGGLAGFLVTVPAVTEDEAPKQAAVR